MRPLTSRPSHSVTNKSNSLPHLEDDKKQDYKRQQHKNTSSDNISFHIIQVKFANFTSTLCGNTPPGVHLSLQPLRTWTNPKTNHNPPVAPANRLQQTWSFSREVQPVIWNLDRYPLWKENMNGTFQSIRTPNSGGPSHLGLPTHVIPVARRHRCIAWVTSVRETGWCYAVTPYRLVSGFQGNSSLHAWFKDHLLGSVYLLQQLPYGKVYQKQPKLFDAFWRCSYSNLLLFFQEYVVRAHGSSPGVFNAFQATVKDKSRIRLRPCSQISKICRLSRAECCFHGAASCQNSCTLFMRFEDQHYMALAISILGVWLSSTESLDAPWAARSSVKALNRTSTECLWDWTNWDWASD